MSDDDVEPNLSGDGDESFLASAAAGFGVVDDVVVEVTALLVVVFVDILIVSAALLVMTAAIISLSNGTCQSFDVNTLLALV